MATRRRPTRDERLAKEVLDILVACGLILSGNSLVGGYNYYFPQVLEIVDPPVGLNGPVEGLIIRILKGQTPDDYAKHAETIAYNLGRERVEVVSFGPYLILLKLWPERATHSYVPPGKGAESALQAWGKRTTLGDRQ